MSHEKVEIGEHTLYLGDCLKIVEKIGPSEITAVVMDPPYGIAYQHGVGGSSVTRRPDCSLRRFTVPIINDDRPFDPAPWLHWPCITFGSNHYAASLPSTGSWLVWDKAAGGGPEDTFVDAEFMWCSAKGVKRNVFRYLWKGVCQAGEKGKRKVHPTQKPVALMVWCLKTLGVQEGDTVIDPYMGSGSTGVACARLGVKFLGCEIDPAYFEIAKKRIAAETEKQSMPLFLGLDPQA